MCFPLQVKMYFSTLHFSIAGLQGQVLLPVWTPSPPEVDCCCCSRSKDWQISNQLYSKIPPSIQLGFNSHSCLRNWQDSLWILPPSCESQLNLNWVSTGISSSSVSVIRFISVFEFQPCGKFNRKDSRTGHITSLGNKHLASRLWNSFVQHHLTSIEGNPPHHLPTQKKKGVFGIQIS